MAPASQKISATDLLARPSSIVLILANLVPLGGVFFLDWRVFDVMMLYWAENVVIGAVNVLRMITCKDGIVSRRLEQQAAADLTETQKATISRVSGGAKFFLIPFFIVHYGMFCFGHLSAITAIFGDKSGADVTSALRVSEYWDSALWLGVIAILISHLVSFFLNFIGGGEYKRTSLSQLMRRPYGRIIALHIAVIVGAALITWLGSPVYMLIVLIGVKIAIDLRMHADERQKFSLA